MLRGFLDAVDACGVPERRDLVLAAGITAAHRFRTGKVDRASHRFCPTPAEFGQETRRLYEAECVALEKPKAIPQPDPKANLSPEKRAEMARRFDGLAADLGNRKRTDDAREEAEKADRKTWINKRMRERFPGSDPATLMPTGK